MRQASVTGPRAFELKDVDVPQPEAGQVLVRVRSVGVCGSDLHFYRGEFPVPPGFVLGHECAGEVEALGEGVTGVAKGDRVALELFDVCLKCVQCRSGNYHLCPSRKANGLNIAGGLREYMAVPAYALYKLPPEVDCELGALCEPLAVAVHGLRLVDLRFGDRVARAGRRHDRADGDRRREGDGRDVHRRDRTPPAPEGDGRGARRRRGLRR